MTREDFLEERVIALEKTIYELLTNPSHKLTVEQLDYFKNKYGGNTHGK